MVSFPPTTRRSTPCFFNDTATTEIYTLSLHDALPIWAIIGVRVLIFLIAAGPPMAPIRPRSEEHTSELQSRLHLVCRLLLEKHTTELQSRLHLVCRLLLEKTRTNTSHSML